MQSSAALFYKPTDRSNHDWHGLKCLSMKSGIDADRWFPHSSVEHSLGVNSKQCASVSTRVFPFERPLRLCVV